MEERTKSSAPILSGVAGAGLGYMAGRSKPVSAEGTQTFTLDEESKELLRQIKTSIEAMGSFESGSPDIYPTVNVTALKNSPSFITFNVITTGALVPARLQEYSIPDDRQLVIKALPTNFGLIYVANTSQNSRNPSQSYWLIANEGVGLNIQNTKSVYISSTIAGEGVLCIVEQGD